MSTQNTMSREEFRRNQREQTKRQQRESRRRLCLLGLTLMLAFGIGVGFGTLLARAESQPQDSSYKYYANIEIERGDTLWALADVYMDEEHYETRGDYIAEVMSINGMVSDRLIAGQKMIVPYYSAVFR